MCHSRRRQAWPIRRGLGRQTLSGPHVRPLVQAGTQAAAAGDTSSAASARSSGPRWLSIVCCIKQQQGGLHVRSVEQMACGG